MDIFFFIIFLILIGVYPAIGIANLILMNKIYNSVDILLSAQYQYFWSESPSPSMSYSWSPSQEPEED